MNVLSHGMLAMIPLTGMLAGVIDFDTMAVMVGDRAALTSRVPWLPADPEMSASAERIWKENATDALALYYQTTTDET